MRLNNGKNGKTSSKRRRKRNNGKDKIAGVRRAGDPGPADWSCIGQHGVNIGQFVSQFNERTKELNGTTVPVVITVYTDKSFTFEVKSPPAAVLLKQAADVAKGSGVPNKEKVGKVTAEQVRQIAQTENERPQRVLLGQGGEDYPGYRPEYGC